MKPSEVKRLVLGQVVRNKKSGILYSAIGRINSIPDRNIIPDRLDELGKSYRMITLFPLAGQGLDPLLHYEENSFDFECTGQRVEKEEWLTGPNPFLRFLAKRNLIGKKIDRIIKEGVSFSIHPGMVFIVPQHRLEMLVSKNGYSVDYHVNFDFVCITEITRLSGYHPWVANARCLMRDLSFSFRATGGRVNDWMYIAQIPLDYKHFSLEE